ncbi:MULTISPECIES: pirin family protein [Ruegeria]|uniref:Pirin family protein n=2 Tax=Ruegeria TaxID=97050 RepID=A0A6B2NHN6_9RHOB|nr:MULTISPECIES: pirin family protein [unclassified Ruegeria]MCU9839680.1 pirin family protein [Ruegeria sp. WL0004]NDW43682.1 pirin family protein [Ruegeria sp. PrR005]
MSWNPLLDTHVPIGDAVDAIETVIVPRARDLGGFEVRRALPAPRRQMVGPFIFFDQMGPAEFLTGQGIDVRPHPHIGLATVTYLYKGRLHHRDSLGTDQWIEPGAVNWMVAGNGVTHSERTDDEARKAPLQMFGIQTWVALPEHLEETGASFEHTPAEALPELEGEGKRVRLILGDAWGAAAPVSTTSEMFYADAVLQPGAALPLPDNHEDRGVYVVGGSVEVAGQVFDTGRMMVFRPGDRLSLKAGPQGARLMLLGGATMGGPRHIWWNFVATSKDRIEAAKEAWRAGDWMHGRFRLPPGDDQEFTPLPAR